MEIASILAGRDIAQILNNPKVLLQGNYGNLGVEEFSHVEDVINSVVLDVFMEDIPDGGVHYILGGGGSSSKSSSSSSATSKARSMAAAALGGVVGGALSELGARAVSFMGR